MTYDQAFKRAKRKTANGAPTIVTNDRGAPHLRRVPLVSSWPRGLGGRHCGLERRATVANVKLSEEKAAEIRAAYGTGRGVTQAKLAEQYGVSTAWVCMVIRGRRW
jgi:hypothetical protein